MSPWQTTDWTLSRLLPLVHSEVEEGLRQRGDGVAYLGAHRDRRGLAAGALAGCGRGLVGGGDGGGTSLDGGEDKELAGGGVGVHFDG